MIADRPFRFLDLPPELRNRIYDFTFADNAPENVKLFSMKGQVPSPAITVTSRQVRNESLLLYTEAIDCFYGAHVLQIDIDLRQLVNTEAKRLPELPSIEGRSFINIIQNPPLPINKLALHIGGGEPCAAQITLVFEKVPDEGFDILFYWHSEPQNIRKAARFWNAMADDDYELTTGPGERLNVGTIVKVLFRYCGWGQHVDRLEGAGNETLDVETQGAGPAHD